jgi:hypothetical protein
MSYDLRPLTNWITTSFEGEVRVGPSAGCYARRRSEDFPHLYGITDMACVFYALGYWPPEPRARTEWCEQLQSLQAPDTGYCRAIPADHGVLHNTAFTLGAMSLLAYAPQHPLRFTAQYAEPAARSAWFEGLDWHDHVYRDSHDGAGLASAVTLVPGTLPPEWMEAYFTLTDGCFDPANGLMGRDKPPHGDRDQIGGTFHYAFLYQYYHRPMPFPEARLDAVLGLQLETGGWDPANPWWLTLDALYLLTRTARQTTHRRADVVRAAHRVLAQAYDRVADPAFRDSPDTTPHTLTAITATLAELQQFLGSEHVVTDRPLRLVLDQRPFI